MCIRQLGKRIPGATNRRNCIQQRHARGIPVTRAAVLGTVFGLIPRRGDNFRVGDGGGNVADIVDKGLNVLLVQGIDIHEAAGHFTGGWTQGHVKGGGGAWKQGADYSGDAGQAV